MQALRADTQTKVRIGPFVDVGDGFTPETGVTLAGGGDNADEAELLKAAGAATVDISAYTWAAIAGCDGWYDLTLAAGGLDTEGVLTVVIQNDSVHLPVHKEFMVMNAPAFDAFYAAAGTDYLPSDLTQIGGNSVAGNAATLTLKQLDIQNNAASALVCKSTGANGHGMDIAGNGTGEGMNIAAGATGNGIQIAATVGNGIDVASGNGDGINVDGGTNGDGMALTGAGTGDGLACVAGATGNGIECSATSGDGIKSAGATNGNGLSVTGAGTGEGFKARGANAGEGKGGGINVANETTLAVRTSDTIFTINQGSAANDAYNNMVLNLYDVTGKLSESRRITDYVGASKTVTVDTAFTFVVAANDLVRIFQSAYAPTVAAGGGATAAQVWDYDVSGVTTQGYAGTYQQIAGGRYG